MEIDSSSSSSSYSHRGVQILVQYPAWPPGAMPSPALQLVHTGSSWGPICGSEGRSQEYRKWSDDACVQTQMHLMMQHLLSVWDNKVWDVLLKKEISLKKHKQKGQYEEVCR